MSRRAKRSLPLSYLSFKLMKFGGAKARGAREPIDHGHLWCDDLLVAIRAM